MAASEAFVQVMSGSFPRFNGCNSSVCNVNGILSIESATKSRRKRSLACHQGVNVSRTTQNGLRVSAVEGTNGVFLRKFDANRSDSTSCKCQRAKSASGIPSEEESKLRFKDEADRPTSLPINGVACSPSIDEHKEKPESNGKLGAAGTIIDKLHDVRANLIEEEAWSLLRASIVYYCNNPIGTIAANDPSSTSTLNYDQVFIRDFIPSGIAFLLKGEYDIVRNFILHTLQLQVMLLIS